MKTDQQLIDECGDQAKNAEQSFSPNRHLVEVPDSFAIARWPRDADVATIARCILGTLKYEPHTADITVLRQALEGVIEHTTRVSISQKQKQSRDQEESGDYDERGEDNAQIGNATVSGGRGG
jgi:hypothetical protein